MKRFALLLLSLGWLVSDIGVASAADAPSKPPTAISYFKQIRPIFLQHCLGCHQPAKPLGGYIMTSYADLLKVGDREKPGVVPKHPEKSFLMEQIQLVNGKAEMPKNRDALSESQIQLVRDWIAQGAIDDTPPGGGSTLIDQEHPPVYRLPPVITALSYSPDNQLLAISGYHEVLVHRADGSELVARLVGLAERVQSLAFSPDGKWLAVAGGSPGRFGEIQIWDVAKKRLKLSVNLTFDTLYGLSWSHDGTRVAVGCGDNTVRAIDVTSGKQVLQQGAHGDWVLGTAFSVDSEFLISVSRDRSVKLTEVPTQRFVDNITSITPGALKGGLSAVDRRPQTTKKMSKVPPDAGNATPKVYDEVVIGGSDGTPRLYKIHREQKREIGDDANKVREYAQMPGRIYALAFVADGSWFAAGASLDGQGEVRVYETETAKQISKFEAIPCGIYALAVRKDGAAVASAGFDGQVRLHDPKTGKLIKVFTPVPLANSK